jgi:hypothetical protein
MLRDRGDDLSTLYVGNLYHYWEKNTHKKRLRRYLKRRRREKKQKTLELIVENGDTFDERTNKTIMLVRKLVARDNNNYANRHNVILAKKKEMLDSGEPLYYNIILNLTKYEKHFTIFYYNLMKYKFQKYNYNKPFLTQFKTIEEKILYVMRNDLSIISGENLVGVEFE